MTCNCNRIVRVSGKCSDMSQASFRSPELVLEHEGYMISGINAGSGDYINFAYCADCGVVKNFKPLSDKDLKIAFNDGEDPDEVLEDEEDDE